MGVGQFCTSEAATLEAPAATSAGSARAVAKWPNARATKANSPTPKRNLVLRLTLQVVLTCLVTLTLQGARPKKTDTHSRYVASGSGYRYGHQGQEQDRETGLVNFELRQYDPRLGRRNNPDPYGQHHSPYLAMSNNPVNYVDPDGGWDDNDVYKWITDFPELVSNYMQIREVENELRAMEAYGMQGSTDYKQSVAQQRNMNMRFNRQDNEREKNLDLMMARAGHLYVNGEWIMSGWEWGGYFNGGVGSTVLDKNGVGGEFGVDLYTREEVLAWHGLTRGGWRENGRGYAKGVNMKELKAYADGLVEFGDAVVATTYVAAGTILTVGIAEEVAPLAVEYLPKFLETIPRLKPLRAPGGKINGATISRGKGYGAKPRFDVHKLVNPSKRTNRFPNWVKNKILPHYHRGKGNGLHRHRPWERSPNDKNFWDIF